jgi:hypothetical protein
VTDLPCIVKFVPLHPEYNDPDRCHHQASNQLGGQDTRQNRGRAPRVEFGHLDDRGRRCDWLLILVMVC